MPCLINIRAGSSSVMIVDMENAGKRGKTCRRFYFRGLDWSDYRHGPQREEDQRAYRLTCALLSGLDHLFLWDCPTGIVAMSYDAVIRATWYLLDDIEMTAPHRPFTIDQDTIRGIDAPRVRLTAGVPGQWDAVADGDGIALNDERDQNNLPAMITSKQTNAQAYSLASKVWDRVRASQTFREASDILIAAGCRLHYYCRMD